MPLSRIAPAAQQQASSSGDETGGGRDDLAVKLLINLSRSLLRLGRGPAAADAATRALAINPVWTFGLQWHTGRCAGGTL